jgi:hypothetical protein
MKRFLSGFLVMISAGSIISGFYYFSQRLILPKHTFQIAGLQSRNDPEEIITLKKKVDTKEGYMRSLAVIGEQRSAKLKKISVARVPDDWVGQWNNDTIKYIFTTDSAPQGVIYDYSDRKAYPGEVDIEKASTSEKISLQFGYPDLPPVMINFGVEGALKVLQRSPEFKTQKEKNPDVFEYYLIETQYDEDKGWRWFVMFFSPEKFEDGNYKKVAYSIDAFNKGLKVEAKDRLKE